MSETRVQEKVGIGRWIGIPIAVVLLLIGIGLYLAPDLSDAHRTAMSWGRIRHLAWDHLKISLVVALIVIAIGVPLGILLTRSGTRKASPFVVAIANFGQAAPAVGLIVLAAVFIGTGFWPGVLALAVYGILPILANTIAGLDSVDQGLVEAGRGMGMTQTAVLWRVEVPLALPVMLSGIRTALVLIVGTAALATFIGAGGLGELIVTGIKLRLDAVLIVGAALIGAMALLIDWLGRVVEQLAKPKGL